MKFNISLNQFNEIASGKYNAGQIDIDKVKKDGTATLKKINNHIKLTGYNNVQLSAEKIVAIKESFIAALINDAGLAPDSDMIKAIKNQLGLGNASNEHLRNKQMLERRMTPLTRQDVKLILNTVRRQDNVSDGNEAIRNRILNSIPSGPTAEPAIAQVMTLLAGGEVNNIIDNQRPAESTRNLANLTYALHSALESFVNNPIKTATKIHIPGLNDGYIEIKKIADVNGGGIVQGNISVKDQSLTMDLGPVQDCITRLENSMLEFSKIRPQSVNENGIPFGKQALISSIIEPLALGPQRQAEGSNNCLLRSLCSKILIDTGISEQDLQRYNNAVLYMCAISVLRNPDTDVNQLLAIEHEDDINNQQELVNADPNNPVNQIDLADNSQRIEEDNQQIIDNAERELVEGPIANEGPVPQVLEEQPALYENPVPNEPQVMNQFADDLVRNTGSTMALAEFLRSNIGTVLHIASGSGSVTNATLNQEQVKGLVTSLVESYTKETGVALDLGKLTQKDVSDLQNFINSQNAEQALQDISSKTLSIIQALDPKNLPYVNPQNTDNLSVNNFANTLVATAKENLSTVLADNVGMILNIAAGKGSIGPAVDEKGEHVDAQLNNGQLELVVKTLMASYATASGKELNLNNLTNGDVENFSIYLQSEQALKTINDLSVRIRDFKEFNELLGHIVNDHNAENNNIQNNAQNLNSTDDFAINSPHSIKPDAEPTALTGITDAKTIDGFLSKLVQIRDNKAELRTFITSNFNTFLALVSGNYDKNTASVFFGEDIENLVGELRSAIAYRTGLSAFNHVPVKLDRLGSADLDKIKAMIGATNIKSGITFADLVSNFADNVEKLPYVNNGSTESPVITGFVNDLALVSSDKMGTYLSDNFNSLIHIATGSGQLGNFKTESGRNIKPILSQAQAGEIVKTISDAYTKATGLTISFTPLTKGDAQRLLNFLQTPDVQNTFKALADERINEFIELNGMTAEVLEQRVAAQTDSTAPTIEPKPIKDEIEPPPQMVDGKTLDAFVRNLIILSKGGRIADLNTLLSQNIEAFLTLVSGRYNASDLNMFYRSDVVAIVKDLRGLVAARTGLFAFTKDPVPFEKLSPREVAKVKVLLSGEKFGRVVADYTKNFDVSMPRLSAEPMQKGTEFLEKGNTVKRTPVNIRDDSTVLNNLEVIELSQMKALPAGKAIAVNVRTVSSKLMEIFSLAGNTKEQKSNIKYLFKYHLDEMIAIANDPEVLKNALAPQLSHLADDISKLVGSLLKELNVLIPDHSIHPNNISQGERNTLFNIIRSPKANATLEKAFDAINSSLNKQLPGFIDKATVEMQSFINSIFNIKDTDKPQHPYSKMSPDEIKNRLDKMDLDSILDEAHTDKNRPGLLAFSITVLRSYFTKLPKQDMAAIMKSAFLTEPADASKNEYEIEGNKRLLSELFKGGGPLLQKMLQGMDKRVVEKSYGDVFDDMKSKLPGIPISTVDEELNKLVEDLKKKKGNTIKDIKRDKSLGAATVGETFLCTMTRTVKDPKTKNLKDEEIKVVVKVMRPGVKQRALNESKIFFDAAKQVPGMADSWKAQYASILKEFDFSNEANNIDEAQFYQVAGTPNENPKKDGTLAPNLHAMKRVKEIPANENVLVLEKADGVSFDQSMAELENNIHKNFAKIFETDPKTGEWITDKNGQPVLKAGIDPETVYYTRLVAHNNMIKLFDHINKVKQVTGKWVKEAFYGNGLFHNDLHGGNMMIDTKGDPSKITLIDFGNIVSLSKDDRNALKNLLIYTLSRSAKDFVSVLKNLMPKPKPDKATMDKVTAIVSSILYKGKGIQDAGYRFMAVLEELRKIGITLPQQIYGVTQGLNRLQTSLDDAAYVVGKSHILYNALMGDVNLSQTPKKETDLDGGLIDSMVSECIKHNNYKKVRALTEKISSCFAMNNPEFAKMFKSNIIKDLEETGGDKIVKFLQKQVVKLDKGIRSEIINLLNESLAKMRDPDENEEFDYKLLDKKENELTEKQKKQVKEFNEGFDSFLQGLRTAVQTRMDKLANDAQLDSKDTRYTDEINQKTGLNDWQARTWSLQDVIGVVADNVGTGKVLSGLGFFSKISTGMSALLVQDYPGGHIRKEPKL